MLTVAVVIGVGVAGVVGVGVGPIGFGSGECGAVSVIGDVSSVGRVVIALLPLCVADPITEASPYSLLFEKVAETLPAFHTVAPLPLSLTMMLPVTDSELLA